MRRYIGYIAKAFFRSHLFRFHKIYFWRPLPFSRWHRMCSRITQKFCNSSLVSSTVSMHALSIKLFTASLQNNNSVINNNHQRKRTVLPIISLSNNLIGPNNTLNKKVFQSRANRTRSQVNEFKQARGGRGLLVGSTNEMKMVKCVLHARPYGTSVNTFPWLKCVKIWEIQLVYLEITSLHEVLSVFGKL